MKSKRVQRQSEEIRINKGAVGYVQEGEAETERTPNGEIMTREEKYGLLHLLHLDLVVLTGNLAFVHIHSLLVDLALLSGLFLVGAFLLG